MTGLSRLVALAAIAARAAHLFATDSPHIVSAATFLGGAVDGQRVTLQAGVSDALGDETNPNYVFLVLDADGETIYAPMRCKPEDKALAERLVDARICATGVCDAFVPAPRRQLGRQFFIASPRDITILEPAPENPFDVPELENTYLKTPDEISRLSHRRIVGRVLASWSGLESLLEDRFGRLVRASFANEPAPAAGTFAEVAGRPVSDVYRVNLERARWRPCAPFDFTERPATNVTAREILLGEDGQIQVKPQFLGRTIVLRGMLRSNNAGALNIESDSFVVPVVVGDAGDRFEIGSVVEATGVCVFDTENWRPNAAFPRIRGFFVVARDADAVKIISRPPWWTPGRLFAVIAFLVAAVVAVLVWNRSLRLLAERRGRALLRTQVAQLKSQLKINERTRLAAELHDSLAQNLTGVSMEISAAQRLLPANASPSALRHLEFASNAIASSRDELRNCLWDLRGEALDEPDMGKAVEFSLRPHMGDAALAIRFNVPRTRLSDVLAHATLRIVRELAINAIRHGGAKSVKVAGCIDGDRLRLSVADDGCGFDPKAAPGIDQGHFGLQGVRERIDGFDGSLSIESAPGKGARVSVSLTLDGGDGEEAS